MTLRQLLLRLWVTDHGDCHFREESLEKVTVVTSKRREDPVNLVKHDLLPCLTRFTEWAGRGARPRRAAFLRTFRVWIGEF
jgi:hypothetical protein